MADDAAPRPPRYSFAASPRQLSRSHSRLVRSLKLLLPVVAAAVVTLLVAWPQLHTGDPVAHPETFSIRPEDADSLRMLNVRFVGTDAHDRPFTVTAEATQQSGPSARRLTLDRPEAEITLGDGRDLALSADSGLFDRDSKMLTLDGAVEVQHDDGYRMRSDEARIDLQSGDAAGDRPVVAEGPAGTATGEGFRVRDRGRTVVFTGRSSVELDPAPRAESP